jgi:hypothetical protein
MSGKILSITALVAAQVFVMVAAAHAVDYSVPEPTTLTLLGAGAAVVAVGAWWSRKK